MNWGGPTFVLIIIALSTGGWLINTWIRARHGYSLENEWGGKTDPAGSQTAAALQSDNVALRSQLDQVAARVQVLERIVTDQGYDVARQIEGLRDVPKAGALTDSRSVQS